MVLHTRMRISGTASFKQTLKYCVVKSKRDRITLSQLATNRMSGERNKLWWRRIVEKTANNLLEEIKKLSSQERAAIVVEVLDTLDQEGEEFSDEELLHELQRREAEGMSDSVSWSVLRELH